MTQVYPLSPVFTIVLNHVISHTPFPCPVNGCQPRAAWDTPLPPHSHWMGVFMYKSFRLEQNHFTCDEAVSELSDQELSIALEEFETTMVDVSELFLPLLQNCLD